ncbi:ethanolaminephosphotransferase 1-like [Hydractinia symbiolongicarpus]|uniref:ethanolaminephosphotransferase 1-like n=1 Tax=Hydractinia symbiolongicarpus TaxID=13093 RepID=UPI00254A9705|nr:ethanolaminephosphotransferase 1-like [Hydractinia symbiolongicarpus]
MASLMLLDYKYLSKKELDGFDKYKYKSVDNSPLSNYVMHPFWNKLVKIFPLWVPANLLTLAGWLLSVLQFVIVSYYDYHFRSSSNPGYETVPNWVWLIGAFCIFWAHQLDGCDGKQARRTNSSSPLGELFDHGLDSSAVWLMGIGILSIYGVGEKTASQWELIFIVVVVLFAFYVAHWEKYTTSVMFLPWAYDVSQLWLAGSYLLTYIYGPELWRMTFYGGTLTFPLMLKSVLYFLVTVFCIPMSLINQIKARQEKPEDCVSITEGFMPLVSLGSVTLLHLVYGYVSIESIVDTQPRLFLIAYGILYANITCRLIIAQMSGEQCERFNILAYPLFPMIALSTLGVASDYKMLVCYVTFLSVAHIHYGIAVVRQLSDHLNVYSFKVGKPASSKPSMNGHHKHTNGVVHSNGAVHDNAVTNGKVSKD